MSTDAPEPMVESDAAAVADLVATAFESRLHALIPYCAPRVRHYLAALAGRPTAFPDRYLSVVRPAAGEVSAFAEFRSVGDTTDLLSYICVAPHARGQRLAERLIRAHLARRPGVRNLQLDVFAHNAQARALYERLGFETVSATDWWTRDLPNPAATTADGTSLGVRDWHLPLASMHRYGFAMIDADWRGRPLRLGLPSSTVVRVPDRAAFGDDELLVAVRHLLPDLGHCLWFGTDPEAHRTPARHVLTSLRLQASTPLRGGRR